MESAPLGGSTRNMVMTAPMGGSVQMMASPQNLARAASFAAPVGGTVQMASRVGTQSLARGGSFIAPVPQQQFFAPQQQFGGSIRMNAAPQQMAVVPQFGGSIRMNVAPQQMAVPLGGSISMPIAQSMPIGLGACGNPGCNKGGTSICSQCNQ